jgi:hypothetical protein
LILFTTAPRPHEHRIIAIVVIHNWHSVVEAVAVRTFRDEDRDTAPRIVAVDVLVETAERCVRIR